MRNMPPSRFRREKTMRNLPPFHLRREETMRNMPPFHLRREVLNLGICLLALGERY